MKINLAQFILELLLEKGEATVPGLGNFSFEEISTTYGAGRKSLLPPQKLIKYSENHKKNSEELANLISAKEGIDISKAHQFIDEFTSQVMGGLMETDKVELAYLGTLNKEANGKLSFAPNPETSQQINKWLPEVALPEAKVKPTESRIKQESLTKPAKQSSTAVAAVPLIENQPDESNENKPLGFLKPLLGLLLLFVILIGGVRACKNDAGVAQNDIENVDEIEEVEYLGNPDAENEEEVEANEVETQAEGVTDEEITETDSDVLVEEEDRMAMNEKAKELGAERCIIILGSFSHSKNIEQATNKIKSKGYRSYQETHGPYTRVGLSIPCFEISEDYKGFIRSIRDEFSTQGAWYLNPEIKI